MWALAGAQSKEASDIFEKNLLIFVGAHGGTNSLVNSSLISLSLFRWNKTLLLHSKHITFTAVLLLLFTLEIGVVHMGWNLHFADIDAGRCSDDITLRDTTQWALVQRVWSGNQQQSRFQNLCKPHKKSKI